MHGLIISCYIRVTEPRLNDRSQNLAQVERLVSSQALHGSESLCKLLRYLARQAVDHPGVPLKEYQIATEVFGRQSDFDPQVDSMVRVQVGRLRTKLAEYYASEGAEDAVGVDLPKGSYALTFHTRQNNAHKTPPQQRHENWTDAVPPPQRHKWAVAVGVLALLLIAAVAVIASLLLTRGGPEGATGAAAEANVPAAYHIFWRGFLTGPEEPWVIFSNALFVGRPEIGMRYFVPSTDSKARTLDHYTGVGEVLAVHSLDTVFQSLHQSVRVKRGTLFSLDDAKNTDLIFIGSPRENLNLLEIPGTQQFVFQVVESGSRAGNVKIVNVHPEAGETKEYLASPSNAVLTEDYAIVGLLHGMNPSRSVLILAGTTTIGTQAAVEYVTRQSSLEELLLRLSVTKSGELKPFEAVIRVKVARGVPVATELVALRKGT